MQDKIRINLETGLYIEPVHPSISGDDIIETPCTVSYYKPKWNGTSWEEGATQEYIDSLKQPISNEPTIEERVATVETKTVTLEETLEVLFGG